MGRIGVLGLAALAVVAGAARAGITDTIGGTIPIGSLSSDVMDEIEAGWDNLGDYTCGGTGSTLVVTVSPSSTNAQACAGRKVTAEFRLLSGATDFEHPCDYQVTCVSLPGGFRLRHAIAFDEDADANVLTPINSGVFEFALDGTSFSFSGGSDVLQILTTEGPLGTGPSGSSPDPPSDAELARVPALGEWGAMLLGAAVLACGVLLILRRRTGSDLVSR